MAAYGIQVQVTIALSMEWKVTHLTMYFPYNSRSIFPTHLFLILHLQLLLESLNPCYVLAPFLPLSTTHTASKR